MKSKISDAQKALEGTLFLKNIDGQGTMVEKLEALQSDQEKCQNISKEILEQGKEQVDLCFKF